MIINSAVTTDSRTLKIGVIRAIITFLDESRLFFTEYLDLRYKAEKLTYSFHYQDPAGAMLFRYDNACHKPALTFADHKHLGDGRMVQAEIPELAAVLGEIMDYFL